jgi:hypothetical protein
MPTIIELRGRGGTDKALARKYEITGATDEADALDALVDFVPTSLATLPLQGFSIEEIVDSKDNDHYFATAHYGTAQKDDPEEDAVEYEFNFQAPSAHIYQSLQTISKTAASGTARDFKGAINVVNDGGKLRVEGYNVAPPPVTFNLRYYPANGSITSFYQTTVENLVGLVNSTSFKGRPAGSLMLVQASGGARNNAGWNIGFGFAYIQNRTSLVVGDITVPSKDGMDLLWAYYEDEKDAAATGNIGLIKKPKFAYVERIFYRGNFNALGI